MMPIRAVPDTSFLDAVLNSEELLRKARKFARDPAFATFLTERQLARSPERPPTPLPLNELAQRFNDRLVESIRNRPREHSKALGWAFDAAQVVKTIGVVGWFAFFSSFFVEQGVVRGLRLGKGDEKTELALGLWGAGEVLTSTGLLASAAHNFKDRNTNAMVADLLNASATALVVPLAVRFGYGPASAATMLRAHFFSLFLYSGGKFFTLKAPAINGLELDGGRKHADMISKAMGFTVGFLLDTIASDTDQFIGPGSPALANLSAGVQALRMAIAATTKTVALIAYQTWGPHGTRHLAAAEDGPFAELRIKGEWHLSGRPDIKSFLGLLKNENDFSAFIMNFVGYLMLIGTNVLAKTGSAAIPNDVARNVAQTAINLLACLALCVLFEYQYAPKHETMEEFLDREHPDVYRLQDELRGQFQHTDVLRHLDDLDGMQNMIASLEAAMDSLDGPREKVMLYLLLLVETIPDMLDRLSERPPTFGDLDDEGRFEELSTTDGSGSERTSPHVGPQTTVPPLALPALEETAEESDASSLRSVGERDRSASVQGTRQPQETGAPAGRPSGERPAASLEPAATSGEQAVSEPSTGAPKPTPDPKSEPAEG